MGIGVEFGSAIETLFKFEAEVLKVPPLIVAALSFERDDEPGSRRVRFPPLSDAARVRGC